MAVLTLSEALEKNDNLSEKKPVTKLAYEVRDAFTALYSPAEFASVLSGQKSFSCHFSADGRWALTTYINGKVDALYGGANINETIYAIECFMGGSDENRELRNKIINEFNHLHQRE